MQSPTVIFLVNGEPNSAMGIRARSFQQRLNSEFRIAIGYRSSNKVRAMAKFLALLALKRPQVCYVFDLAFSGILAAGLYRLISKCRMVVDTGDAIYELSRNSGNRGRLGLLLTRLLEWFAFTVSDRAIVRAHPHQEMLATQGIAATVIPDGVDVRQFYPRRDNHLRQKYALEGFTVLGLLGSLIWNRRWQMCYGLELIETLDRLRDLPIKGIIIGDGSGLSELKRKCAAAGLENRILFLGRIPYDDLPAYINMMDVCLSTQTNDIPGQVRTTGKLPLYLACGKFVLASAVGEAARVLPPEMLVTYNGIKDEAYPSRLAKNIRQLLKRPGDLDQSAISVAIAKQHFDYDLLTIRVRDSLYGLLSGRGTVPEPAPSLPTKVEPHSGSQC